MLKEELIKIQLYLREDRLDEAEKIYKKILDDWDVIKEKLDKKEILDSLKIVEFLEKILKEKRKKLETKNKYLKLRQKYTSY